MSVPTTVLIDDTLFEDTFAVAGTADALTAVATQCRERQKPRNWSNRCGKNVVSEANDVPVTFRAQRNARDIL